MAFRPEGAVFYAGRDLAGLLPWRKDARLEKQLLVAKTRQENIKKDEINDLGLTRPFTPDKVSQLDRVLNVADELDEHPLVATRGNGSGRGQHSGNGHGRVPAATTEVLG